MLTFDDETGNVIIEGFDLPVVLRPPKYGHMKRLKAERNRIAEETRQRSLALPAIPDPGDEEGVNDADTRARLGRERVEMIEQLNLDTMEQFWRFIFFGDDSCVGLADPAPPVDADEWPAELLFDSRPIIRGDNGVPIVTAESVFDRMFTHWGKVRSRSGPRA